MIVVHLHNTKKGGTSTALLVDNTTTKQGTTVLLPNSLSLTDDDGTTTTLAKSVDDDGSSGTRDSLDTVLGTDIEGTWRLDTPYLQNLVDLVGNIDVDTNADVPDPDARRRASAPLVNKGKSQTLSGKTAVAYATYRASGEAQNAQLERFGQVMQGVLRKLSSDPTGGDDHRADAGADPGPLTHRQGPRHLPRQARRPRQGRRLQDRAAARAERRHAERAGRRQRGQGRPRRHRQEPRQGLGRAGLRPERHRRQGRHREGPRRPPQRRLHLPGRRHRLHVPATSKVVYADAADKENATEVAKTLGLPAGAVTKGTTASNADVSVVLGQDYKPSSS